MHVSWLPCCLAWSWVGPPAGAGAPQRKLVQVSPLGRVPHTQAASTTTAVPAALASCLLPRLASPLANAHPSPIPSPCFNLLQKKYLNRACLPCHEFHTEGAKRRKVGSIGPSERFIPVVRVRGRGLRAWPDWGTSPQSMLAEGGWVLPGTELWRSCRLHACSLSISLTSTSCDFLGYSEASPSPVSFLVKSLPPPPVQVYLNLPSLTRNTPKATAGKAGETRGPTGIQAPIWMNFKQNQWPFYLSKRKTRDAVQKHLGSVSPGRGDELPQPKHPFSCTPCMCPQLALTPPCTMQASPHHSAGPSTPWHILTMCSCVHRGHVDALLPQGLQRDVPRPGGVGQKGGWTDWALGSRAPPRFRSKRRLASASQACVSAAFVCVFAFAFVCWSVFLNLHPIKVCH